MAFRILLSFDVEEFDLPREHGGEISLEEGVKVSSEGLEKIIKLCRKHKIKATFFCTGNFAKLRPDIIKQIILDGHEVACHGVDHFKPKTSDIKKSKEIIERVADAKVIGYRQPRMFKIDCVELYKCGYLYDSSVNPALIPGRYNHLDVPTKPFLKGKILEIPTSVATALRVPLFWLALHLLPKNWYYFLAKKAVKKNGYLATYFHPWEFFELREHPEYKMPFIIRNHSGQQMVDRLDRLVAMLRKRGHEFITYNEFVDRKIESIQS